MTRMSPLDLRVATPHHPLEPGPHVHELPPASAAVRDHPGPDGHRLHGLEHVGVALPARAADGVAALPPVAVHGPHRLAEEPPGGCAVAAGAAPLALEGDPDEAGGHLLDEGAGRGGELEEEGRVGPGIVLDREADVALAVAEERPGDAAAQVGGRPRRRLRRQCQPPAPGEHHHRRRQRQRQQRRHQRTQHRAHAAASSALLRRLRPRLHEWPHVDVEVLHGVRGGRHPHRTGLEDFPAVALPESRLFRHRNHEDEEKQAKKGNNVYEMGNGSDRERKEQRGEGGRLATPDSRGVRYDGCARKAKHRINIYMLKASAHRQCLSAAELNLELHQCRHFKIITYWA
ncbi:hypothetical protein H6P81_001854 [Aristolochia fimbriata]|uniref:Uncharacterized protein n=1 Tax=Aristolochia fimbriata TaxID=158543 RepID=A0AAV7FBB3_ARIFI|nr:hypothetical protein H6P81_001854 [Aristolochia fimbriata]